MKMNVLHKTDKQAENLARGAEKTLVAKQVEWVQDTDRD